MMESVSKVQRASQSTKELHWTSENEHRLCRWTVGLEIFYWERVVGKPHGIAGVLRDNFAGGEEIHSGGEKKMRSK